MDFRRSGSADERRRRVLRDEMTGQAEEGSETSATVAFTSKRNTKRRYGDGALAENQPPITHFLPQSAFSLLFLGLTLLTAIAALETAYISLAVRGWFAREPRLAMFDLAASGTWGQWLAGGMFAAAAGLAFFNYRLRAHRLDDFRGKYRLWIVVIGACILGSIDVTTGAHAACGAVAELLSGSPFLGMRDGWWIAIYAGVFGTIGLRLGIEIRAVRGALSLLIFATALFCVAGLMTSGIAGLSDPVEKTVLLSCSWLLGVWSVFMSQAIFARHVYLDAQGLLAEGGSTTKTKAKRRKTRSSRTATADENAEETDDSVDTQPLTVAGKNSQDTSDEESSSNRLSKSERRKLKKQQGSRRAA